MNLAKPHFDVGLFTNNEAAMLAFWQEEVGLPFTETLPLGGGVRQQRHDMNGSVLKINAARDPLPPSPPCGYRELAIASDSVTEPRELRDPDGNRVILVPGGHQGITGIRMHLAVRDAADFARFYGDTLGLERVDDQCFRCGSSLLCFAESNDVVEAGAMRGPGFRYLTVQVWDVDAEHRGFLERGATEGTAPATLGDVARISFVRDPDGNWIEVSQRASLTGPLPGHG